MSEQVQDEKARRGLSDEELNAIRARVGAATPGPWGYDLNGHVAPVGDDREWGPTVVKVLPGCLRDADGEFIAHAREDVPRLLSELRRTCDTLPACGRNAVLDADLVGCGQVFIRDEDIYRCADCDVPFHKPCIRKHFDKGDVLTEEIVEEQMRREREREGRPATPEPTPGKE